MNKTELVEKMLSGVRGFSIPDSNEVFVSRRDVIAALENFSFGQESISPSARESLSLEIESLTDEIETLTAKVAYLQARRHTLIKEKKSAVEKCKKATKELGGLKGYASNLEDRYFKLLDELADAERRAQRAARVEMPVQATTEEKGPSFSWTVDMRTGLVTLI